MEASGQLYSCAKSPRYPKDSRLGGIQSRSGHCSEEKNSQPLLGLESPIIQPVAQPYTTELSRLLVFIYGILFSLLAYFMEPFPLYSLYSAKWTIIVITGKDREGNDSCVF
jgi:hypothetical protein